MWVMQNFFTPLYLRSLAASPYFIFSKNSLVTQLLKKPSLEKEVHYNYRPVSHLPLIYKLTERIVLSRISDHLSSNSPVNTHQSGLILPSCTQPKPFLLPCIINLVLPSLINKSPVSASSIYMQPLTPSTASWNFKDCLPGSVLLTPLSSGFSFRSTSRLALSPLK